MFWKKLSVHNFTGFQHIRILSAAKNLASRQNKVSNSLTQGGMIHMINHWTCAFHNGQVKDAFPLCILYTLRPRIYLKVTGKKKKHELCLNGSFTRPSAWQPRHRKYVFFFFVATVVPRFILVIVTIAINFNERVRQREGEMRRTCDSVTVDSWGIQSETVVVCVKQAAWRRPVTLIWPYHWDRLPLPLHCQCGKWDCPGWNMQRTTTSFECCIYTRADIISQTALENQRPDIGARAQNDLQKHPRKEMCASTLIGIVLG